MPAPGDRRSWYKTAANQAAKTATYVANRVAYNQVNKAVKYASSKKPAAMSKSSKPKKAAKKKNLKQLSQKVHDIEKQIKSSNGTLIYRKRNINSHQCTQNSMSLDTSASVKCSDLELVLAQLRFFDPSTPGTLINGSGASATYEREYLFKNMYMNYTARNNFTLPVYCTLYLVCSREDTSIEPATAFTNGLNDVGAPTATSPLVHLTDSEQFNSLWKIVKSQKKLLQPGALMTMTNGVKDVEYNPAEYDSHALPYQKKYGTFAIVCRLEGVICHDTVAPTTQIGTGTGQVDVIIDTKYEVEYDAGVDLKFIVQSNNSVSMTTAACQANKPVSDVQIFESA